jgi:hypothetical protein
MGLLRAVIGPEGWPDEFVTCHNRPQRFVFRGLFDVTPLARLVLLSMLDRPRL